MSEKLKPCPHCETEMRIEKVDVPVVGYRVRGNHKPTCYGEVDSGPTYARREDCAAAWNDRPREDRLVKLLREARHGIDRLHEGDCGGPAVEPCRWCRLRAAIDAELGERPWTNKRIAEFMDAISEHSVLVAPAPDGTILVTDAGETLIATSEGWKPWDPEHDIRCWHGEHGILAKIEEKGLQPAFVRNVARIVGEVEVASVVLSGDIPLGEFWSRLFCLIRAEAPQLAAALVKVIEEAPDA